MAAEANTVIKKATDILTAMSRDEEERLRYEAREQFLFDQQYTLQAAKREGKEEGILIGKEEGILIGKEEGVKSNKKETAISLIALGVDDEVISKATKLPLEEVRRLREQ
jgi:predicted transposase/invertase (TIGR01784 family)